MFFPRAARAEKTLATDGDWTLYTDGRAGVFVSYVHGQGRPLGTYPDGVDLAPTIGGGYDPEAAAREPIPGSVPPQSTQGRIEEMRVRSGFISNTMGLGVRGPIGYSKATAYIQLWILAETNGRTKNQPNIVEARQAYAKLEGWWGSLTAGRQRALVSRGATDIDVLYAHRYGLGSPGNLEGNGPTAGQIGFGVLGSGFAPGVVYATPVLRGFQLSLGAYDPIQIPAGTWTRTKYVRPESEATFERPIGDLGKLVLFGNGLYQRVYHNGQPDSIYSTAAGVGYGGRLELGPARLGVAGHYGKGLGLTYALETSEANTDVNQNLRKFDGYYVQGMVVAGRLDIFAGWGIARVFLSAADRVPDPTTGFLTQSVIKYQMGNNAGVVFHVKPWLHFDLDFFRADFKWNLGEEQVVYIANTGMTMSW
jgi:predicted porin